MKINYLNNKMLKKYVLWMMLASVWVTFVACRSAEKTTAKDEKIFFETEQYIVSISPVSGDAEDVVMKAQSAAERQTLDTLEFYGTLPLTAYNLVIAQSSVDSTFDAFCGPTLYVWPSNQEVSQHYRIVIVNKKPDASPDFLQVVRGMVDNSPLTSDTSYENMYVLSVKDESQFASMYSNDDHATDVRGFVMSLRGRYSLPVVNDNAVNTDFPLLYRMEETIDMDLEEYLTLLRDKYGIEVRKQNHARMQVIKFN
ncbi:MAG: hypothetical protein IJ785_08445 [Bacteroidales bacterium]|nr:hypothetical protein [Bacteroidales bacterium]